MLRKLRLQIDDYTDPSVPVEVEAQAKPAGGSRGCKIIKIRRVLSPTGFYGRTHSAC